MTTPPTIGGLPLVAVISLYKAVAESSIVFSTPRSCQIKAIAAPLISVKAIARLNAHHIKSITSRWQVLHIYIVYVQGWPLIARTRETDSGVGSMASGVSKRLHSPPACRFPADWIARYP